MALYRFSAKPVKRSNGSNAVAKASYRSGTKLTDHKLGKTFDYTRKQKVSHTRILLPDNAPKEFADREILWNEVERSEKRKDSQLCRSIDISIPKEFTKEQAIELVANYCQTMFADQGMIVDMCFHNLGEDNPHVHLMITMRTVDKNGFGLKNREWNNDELFKLWRKYWADYVNHKFEQLGMEERVDHRTNKERGLVRIPNIQVPAQQWNDYYHGTGYISQDMQSYLDIEIENKRLLLLHEEYQEILAHIESLETQGNEEELEKYESITEEIDLAVSVVDEVKKLRNKIDKIVQLPDDDFSVEKSEELRVLNRKEQELINTLRKDKKRKIKKYH